METDSPNLTADTFTAIEAISRNLDSLINTMHLSSIGMTLVLTVLVFFAIFIFGRSGQKMKEEINGRLEAEIRDSRDRRKEFEDRLQNQTERLEKAISSDLQEFEDSLDTRVLRIAFDENENSKSTLDKLRSHASALRAEIDEYEKLRDVVAHTVQEATKVDPFENFTLADNISDQLRQEAAQGDTASSEFTRDRARKRLRAMNALQSTLDFAMTETVDANLMFNSGMVASRLEFEDHALKLLTIAATTSPTSSHRLAMYRLRMTTGQSYDYLPPRGDAPGALKAISQDPIEIVDEAYSAALKAAARAPLPQNEIIYAELWNMSQKVREDGGYERMRDVLLASYKAREGLNVIREDFSNAKDRANFEAEEWDQADMPIPSNLCGKIAATYALLGTNDWHGQYVAFLRKGIEIAASESKLTTWRNTFLRDARNTASRLDLEEEFLRMCAENGVEPPQDPNAALLQQLQQMAPGRG